MTKLKFDDGVRWGAIEKAIPGSKEALEEIYLVLRIMGSSPEFKSGRKSGHKRKKKQSTYYKYSVWADNKKHFTIYIYEHERFTHKIRYYNGVPGGIITHIENLNDLKRYLIDWLEKY